MFETSRDLLHKCLVSMSFTLFAHNLHMQAFYLVVFPWKGTKCVKENYKKNALTLMLFVDTPFLFCFIINFGLIDFFFISKFHHYLNRFIISSRPILRSWPFWLSLHEILFSIKDKSADSIYNSSEDCAQYHTQKRRHMVNDYQFSYKYQPHQRKSPVSHKKHFSVTLKSPPPPLLLFLLMIRFLLLFLFFSPILMSSCFPKHLDECDVQPAQSYLL